MTFHQIIARSDQVFTQLRPRLPSYGNYTIELQCKYIAWFPYGNIGPNPLMQVEKSPNMLQKHYGAPIPKFLKFARLFLNIIVKGLHFKRKFHKMVKQTEITCRLLQTNCLSVLTSLWG